MKFEIIIVSLVCAVMNVAAQQLYPDTFRMAEQDRTAEIDELLLDMVGAQSAELHAHDTLDTLTLAEVLYRDSVIQEQREVDSLRTLNADLVPVLPEQVQVLHVERSWVKDEEEDRKDMLQALRESQSPWRKEATLMLQLTQHYVTDNWYQGGSSSFAGYGIAKGWVHYITDRFTWENTGEWRMGGSTVSNDSLHKVNTTDDLLRLYSKANYRVVPKLFTSVSAEMETRLLPTYKANSNELKSAPFAPFRFTAALGIDYKPVTNLSLSVSPLSYKVICLADDRVSAKDYGLDEGQTVQHNVGSSLRVEYTWKPVREVVLDTKFYLYTNYKNVEIDLEVNCDFIINRFLSARLVLHPRYDSSVIMEGDSAAKMQFRELLSLGFAHKFR